MIATRTAPSNLAYFQTLQGRIFGLHDAHLYTEEETIVKIFGLIGRLAKSCRKSKGQTEAQGLYLSKLFRWYLRLCNLLRFSVPEIFWDKYPGICPYCDAKADCCCEDKGRNPTLSLRCMPGARRPVSISGWQEMFEKIYGKVDADKGVFFAIARLIEETQEVAEELSSLQPDIGRLKSEVADLGVWIFSLASLLKIELQRNLLLLFPGICPDCNSEMCVCPKRWLD